MKSRFAQIDATETFLVSGKNSLIFVLKNSDANSLVELKLNSSVPDRTLKIFT